MCKVSTMRFFKSVIASLPFVSTGEAEWLWAEQQRIHLKKIMGVVMSMCLHMCGEKKGESRNTNIKRRLQRAHFLNKTCSLFDPKASSFLELWDHQFHPVENKPASPLRVGIPYMYLLSPLWYYTPGRLFMLCYHHLYPATPLSNLRISWDFGKGCSGRLDFAHLCFPWLCWWHVGATWSVMSLNEKKIWLPSKQVYCPLKKYWKLK